MLVLNKMTFDNETIFLSQRKQVLTLMIFLCTINTQYIKYEIQICTFFQQYIPHALFLQLLNSEHMMQLATSLLIANYYEQEDSTFWNNLAKDSTNYLTNSTPFSDETNI